MTTQLASWWWLLTWNAWQTQDLFKTTVSVWTCLQLVHQDIMQVNLGMQKPSQHKHSCLSKAGEATIIHCSNLYTISLSNQATSVQSQTSRCIKVNRHKLRWRHQRSRLHPSHLQTRLLRDASRQRATFLFPSFRLSQTRGDRDTNTHISALSLNSLINTFLSQLLLSHYHHTPFYAKSTL